MLVAQVVLGQLRLQDVLKPLGDQYAGDINERDFVLGGHDAHVLLVGIVHYNDCYRS